MAKMPESGSFLSFGGFLPFAIVAALLGFSLPSFNSEGPSNKEKTSASGKEKGKKAPAGPPSPLRACGDDINAVLKEYFGECGNKNAIDANRLPKFLIATIPHPGNPSLASMSESFLDSLRLAMTSQGYVPVSIGPLLLPAAQPEVSGEPQHEKTAQPGIWLFAKGTLPPSSDNRLMVLIIGEDPVSGIDLRQFATAIDQIGKLVPNGVEEVLLLGPTFSGSAKGLASALKAPSQIKSIRAASGTAALSGLGKEFEPKAFKSKVAWSQLAVVDPLKHAINHINKRYGDPVARILSEAHTLYGSHGDYVENVPVTYLPRDLSLLRAAYREQPNLYNRIFPTGNISSRLPVPLSAASTLAEMPVYMGETTAKSQETSLIAFARRLKAERVEFLGIQVTDRLDALFLARFFAEEAPNVRVFLIGSDVLFNIGASRGSLTGTLTFSSYPIGAAGKDPLPQSNDAAAGFGEALKFLVDPVKNPVAPLPFYCSVIGRGGEWTIEPATTEKDTKWTAPKGRSGPLLAFLVSLLIATFVPIGRWWLTARLLRPAVLATETVEKREKKRPGWLDALKRNYFIGLRRLKGALDRTLRRLAPYAVVQSISAEVEKEEISDGTITGREIKRRWWLRALCVIWALLAYLAVDMIIHQFERPRPPSVMRFVSLTNGVNPLIPGVCFLLSWYSFVWMRVRGRFIDNYSFHVLPKGKKPTTGANPVTLDNPAIFDSCQELISAMQSGFSFWSLAGCCGAVVICLLAYDLRITSVEGGHQPGDLAWTVLAVGTYTTALGTLIYFMRVWVLLFNVLRKLESHPIRNAFTRLPDRISWTTIWTLGGLRPTFVSLQLAADYLAILHEKIPPPGEPMPSAANKELREKIARTQELAASVLTVSYAATFPDFLPPDDDSKTRPGTLLLLQKKCEEIANDFQEDLAVAWRASRLEGWRGASIDYSSAEQRTKYYALGAIENVRNREAEGLWTPLRKLKEEFLALLFSSYIRYVFIQLRNLAGSAAVSVSMLFLAIHSYPFHPYQGLLNAATFLFFSIAVVFITVFYQMDIDPLLSRLSDTQSGKLDAGFPKRLIQFGLFPTVTYLVSQFPDIGDVFLRLSEVIPGLPK